MNFPLGSHELYSSDSDVLGGKAFNLVWLSRQGFPVPKFWVVDADMISDIFRANQFHLPGGLDRLEPAKVSILLAEIRDKIASFVLTEPQRNGLQTVLEPLIQAESFFAVRSSAVGEDSAGASFAGQMDSFLFQKTMDQVEQSLFRCIASFFNERAFFYRLEKGLPVDNIRGAVVIQEMVFGEVSGVFFTANPISGKRDEGLISACYGCGEGVVSGVCNTDEFTLAMKNGDIRSQQISTKDVQCVFDQDLGYGTKEVPIDQALQESSCLSPNELLALWSAGKAISDGYRFPQDIEWTIRDQQIFILQSRPVTKLPDPRACRGKEIVWDNSNIQESYNGVTTPLTFSFASQAYAMVYEQTCHVLGIKPEVIQKMTPTFENLIGLINGRVYYNINNWYRGLLVLPSFGTNKADMERMMGLQDPVDFVEDQVLTKREKLQRLPQLLSTLVKMLKSFRQMPKLVDQFLENFEYHYRKIKRNHIHRLEVPQLIEMGRYLKKNVQMDWTTPILNDFYVMMMNGRVHRSLVAAKIERPESLQNNLMAGEEGIESTEPTKYLLRLCDLIRENEGLMEVFAGDTKGIYEALQVNHPEFFADCLQYIERYGDRTMGELKLESITLRQDPSFMFDVIKNYLKNDQLSLASLGEREEEMRINAEKEAYTAARKQGLLSKWKLKRNVKRLREAVKNRENMRLARTRLFGLYRSIYLEIGEQLAFYGHLDDPRDIFYLSYDELNAFDEGRSIQTHFKGLVKSRKAEYASYEAEEPPHHFKTKGTPYYQNTYVYEGDQEDIDPNLKVFKGLGCYPGIVTAKVKIIFKPEEAADIEGQILCTVRTDPGWAPLFPSSGGILVERGSTLSHSAVVARELGIPAVVGVPGITKLLKDGDLIRLDGEAGTITRLEDDE